MCRILRESSRKRGRVSDCLKRKPWQHDHPGLVLVRLTCFGSSIGICLPLVVNRKGMLFLVTGSFRVMIVPSEVVITSASICSPPTNVQLMFVSILGGFVSLTLKRNVILSKIDGIKFFNILRLFVSWINRS